MGRCPWLQTLASTCIQIKQICCKYWLQHVYRSNFWLQILASACIQIIFLIADISFNIQMRFNFLLQTLTSICRDHHHYWLETLTSTLKNHYWYFLCVPDSIGLIGDTQVRISLLSLQFKIFQYNYHDRIICLYFWKSHCGMTKGMHLVTRIRNGRQVNEVCTNYLLIFLLLIFIKKTSNGWQDNEESANYFGQSCKDDLGGFNVIFF